MKLQFTHMVNSTEYLSHYGYMNLSGNVLIDSIVALTNFQELHRLEVVGKENETLLLMSKSCWGVTFQYHFSL